MDLDFGKSEIFELMAEGDVRFFVHKDILSSQSEPFREATCGVWTEAAERRISLKDWDGETVARMIQFLYKGDYQYPEPAPISPASDSDASVRPQTCVKAEETTELCNRPLTPLDDWIERTIPARPENIVPRPVKLENFDPSHYDFKETLLSHAKVYALAHFKSIDSLRDLAYERLLLTLSHLDPIPPDSHLSMNLVDLASYGYSNTDCLSNSQEPLRNLISQFTALNLKAWQTEPEAIGLISSVGDFTKDVIRKVCRTLPDRPGRLANANTRFISGLRLVRGNHQPPADCVREVQGLSCNMNHPYEGTFEWLVPEYTMAASDACTSFKVSNVAQTNATDQNIAVDYGYNCYLQSVKESNNHHKITELALVRSPAHVVNPAVISDYDGTTGEFVYHWIGGADKVYLVWKTVKVALV